MKAPARLRRIVLAAILAAFCSAGLSAMPGYGGSLYYYNGNLNCVAHIDEGNPELGWQTRDITLYLYGPDEQFLQAFAWGVIEPGNVLNVWMSVASVGPGTYRCHVVYREVIDDPYSEEVIHEDYYATVN
jgi:hypothetical protein